MSLPADTLVNLVESALIAIGLLSIALIKTISFCDKKRARDEELELLRAQAEFNNVRLNNIIVEQLPDSTI